MSRLFISSREIDFINDIGKELIKDVIYQKIYYYPISLEKSNVHAVYEESIKKVFENPIEIECIVDWQAPDIKTGQYGQDNTANITLHVASRDLIEKNIEIQEGSYFTYGEEVYEITKVRNMRNIYGLVEYDDGIEITGIRSRKDVFTIKPPGPTREDFDDPEAVTQEFKQQRGMVEGDQRDMYKSGAIDPPEISKPARVNKSGFVGESDD